MGGGVRVHFFKVSEIQQEQMQRGPGAGQVNKFGIVKFYGLLTFAHLPFASPQENWII